LTPPPKKAVLLEGERGVVVLVAYGKKTRVRLRKGEERKDSSMRD
jgi:hypothetical protein